MHYEYHNLGGRGLQPPNPTLQVVGQRSVELWVSSPVDGEKQDMHVLVTMEDTTPLLGMDYPHFDDVWRELAKKRAKREQLRVRP